MQLACDIEATDDDAALARILERQLAHFQPEGNHAPVELGDDPYGKKLSAIRGLRLTVTEVRAKFKFGGNRTSQHREVVAKNLGEPRSLLDREARTYTRTRRGTASPAE